jgi:hypothetical protein
MTVSVLVSLAIGALLEGYLLQAINSDGLQVLSFLLE